MTDPFAPISGTSKRARGDRELEWKPIAPVPAEAAPPPPETIRIAANRQSFGGTRTRRANSSTMWPVSTMRMAARLSYRSAYCRPEGDGVAEWRWQALEKPRPLYRLDALAAHPDAPVIVVEGEKAADAAQRLLPDLVATTSSGGCKAAAKANWSPLRGRRIVIWPDADSEGAEYARSVARLVHAADAQSVAIMEVPTVAAKGWDAADAEAEGWDTAKVMAMIESAKVVAPEPPKREQASTQKDSTARPSPRPPR